MPLVLFNTSQNLTSHPRVFHTLSRWQPWFMPNRKLVAVHVKQRSANYSPQVKSGPKLFFFFSVQTIDWKEILYFVKFGGENPKKNYFMTPENSNFHVHQADSHTSLSCVVCDCSPDAMGELSSYNRGSVARKAWRIYRLAPSKKNKMCRLCLRAIPFSHRAPCDTHSPIAFFLHERNALLQLTLHLLRLLSPSRGCHF